MGYGIDTTVQACSSIHFFWAAFDCAKEWQAVWAGIAALIGGLGALAAAIITALRSERAQRRAALQDARGFIKLVRAEVEYSRRRFKRVTKALNTIAKARDEHQHVVTHSEMWDTIRINPIPILDSEWRDYSFLDRDLIYSIVALRQNVDEWNNWIEVIKSEANSRALSGSSTFNDKEYQIKLAAAIKQTDSIDSSFSKVISLLDQAGNSLQ